MRAMSTCLHSLVEHGRLYLYLYHELSRHCHRFLSSHSPCRCQLCTCVDRESDQIICMPVSCLFVQTACRSLWRGSLPSVEDPFQLLPALTLRSALLSVLAVYLSNDVNLSDCSKRCIMN